MSENQEVGWLHSMDLTEAIQITDEFARTQLGAESDATEFMTYIASAESNYGNYE